MHNTTIRGASKDEKFKTLFATAEMVEGKLSFCVHNHNAGFNEVESFFMQLREEVERQLANKEKCPFYEKHI